MKKTIPFLFAFTILLVACSKEKKLNKKLDGEWKVVSINGKSPKETDAELESITLSFSTEEENGTYKMTFLWIRGGVSLPETISGAYTLTEDEEITLTPSTAGATKYVFKVVSYSRSDLTLTRIYNGEVFLLEKK